MDARAVAVGLVEELVVIVGDAGYVAAVVGFEGLDDQGGFGGDPGKGAGVVVLGRIGARLDAGAGNGPGDVSAVAHVVIPVPALRQDVGGDDAPGEVGAERVHIAR